MANCTRCRNPLLDANFKVCVECRTHLSTKVRTKRPGLKTSNNKNTIRRQTRLAAGLCYYCDAPANGLTRCRQCTIRDVNTNRERRIKYRCTVISHYGNQCACCGDNTDEFLTLDHKDGGGNEHRKKGHGEQYWKWFIKNNYPINFQVLCFNCNSGRDINGGSCPGNPTTHKLALQTVVAN